MRLVTIATVIVSTLSLLVNCGSSGQLSSSSDLTNIIRRSAPLSHSPIEIKRRHRISRALTHSMPRRGDRSDEGDDEENGDEYKNTTISDVKRRHHHFHGRATFYHGGPMACGGTKGPNEIFAAMSSEMFQGGARCGASVTVKDRITKKKITVTITDECPGCKRTQLDLSQGAFDQLGKESTGVLRIKWWFN